MVTGKAHPNSVSEFELQMGSVGGIELGSDKLAFKQCGWWKFSRSQKT